jgi:hypothetical protein
MVVVCYGLMFKHVLVFRVMFWKRTIVAERTLVHVLVATAPNNEQGGVRAKVIEQ